jgi:hypothetical protein
MTLLRAASVIVAMPSLTASLNSGTAGPSLSAILGCGIALLEVRKCHQERGLRPAARRAAVPVALALPACQRARNS